MLPQDQRLARATNALRRFTVAPPQGHSGSDVGESLGGAGAALASRVNRPKAPAKAPVPTHDPAMYKTYMAGTGAAVGMAQAGQPYVDNQAVLDAADKNVQTNKLAEEARMGGAFTPNGLENAAKQAEANGADRLRLKSMLGLAATRVPGVGVVPMAGAQSMSPGMGPGGF